MRHIFRTLKPYEYIFFFLIFGLIVLQTFFEMELIGFVEELLDLIGISTNTADYWSVGLKMIGTAVIILVAIICVNILASYLSSKIAMNLRREVFKKVNSFSATEINKFSTASLITRSTNDVSQVQQTFMMCLRMMFTAPCMAFFAIRKITMTNITLTWVTAGYLLVMIALLITINIFVKLCYKKAISVY